MRSAVVVCLLAVFGVACGGGVDEEDGGSGGGTATGGGKANGGGSENGGGSATGGGSSSVGGGQANGGGTAGTGGGTAATCSASSCAGCCFNNTCQNGDTVSACGKSGQACKACATGTVCLVEQACGIDPNSMWVVQPANVSVSTMTNAQASWDALGGAPDPYAQLYCPSSATAITSTTEVDDDVFMAQWTTGSCVMSAKDLMNTGFAIEVWDEDTTTPDSILGRTPLSPTQNDLLSGEISFTNGSTCENVTISLTRQ